MKHFSKFSIFSIILIISFSLSFKANAQTAYAYNMVGQPNLPVGFVSFNVWEPGVMTPIPNTLSSSYLVGGTWANGVWYGINYMASKPAMLFSIDPVTGNNTIIGSTGVINSTALTFDITTNTMFMLDADTSQYISHLYTVDLSTGAATLVGSTNEYYVLSLACNADGELYGYSIYYNSFYRIDKTTGESIFIGNSGINSNNANEMEFDRENDILFAYIRDVDQPVGSQRKWWTMDIETGEATLIGELQGDATALGLAIPYTMPELDRPQLVTPAHKSVKIETQTSFNWEAVTNAVKYTLEISTDKLFRTVDKTIENISTNSYALTEEEQLINNIVYYWRIKAFNGNNDASWFSKKFKFRTIGENQTLNIPLTLGWNLISLNVIPDNLNMENIFNGMNNIVVVKNAAGDIYYPALGINQIGEWRIDEAYFVYTNAYGNLSVSGMQVFPSQTPILLEEGWNLIPYLGSNPMDIEQALASIPVYMTFAKNKMGDIYHPEFGINTIGNMKPGEGYWIYMATRALLIYPE